MIIEEFESLKDKSIGHNIIKLGRVYKEFVFASFYEKANLPGLKQSHLDLLPYIDFTGTTIVEIAQKMNISKQAVSPLIKDLIDWKVLIKKDNPKDKRSFLISFNVKGKNNILEGLKILTELDSFIIKNLGKKKSEELLKLLLSLLKLVEK